jgi:hypothetical protein
MLAVNAAVASELEGSIYVHGAGIDIRDVIVLKGRKHLLLLKCKR